MVVANVADLTEVSLVGVVPDVFFTSVTVAYAFDAADMSPPGSRCFQTKRRWKEGHQAADEADLPHG